MQSYATPLIATVCWPRTVESDATELVEEAARLVAAAPLDAEGRRREASTHRSGFGLGALSESLGLVARYENGNSDETRASP